MGIRLTARMSIIGACAAAAVVVGAGSASAAPSDAVIDTRCSFDQIVAATYAVSPEEGEALANTPFRGQFSAFLSSPVYQRQLLLYTQPWIADRISSVLAGPGAALSATAFRTCSQF